MCGIAGCYEFQQNRRVSQSFLTTMRDTMPHRGPDGVGAWIDQAGQIGLAHRRLAIIDLSPEANQPMSNLDRTLHVVYNGEIYNHAEIRSELLRSGQNRWKTDHSDTEVILHAFEKWGVDCLKKFRGMFAMAVWDARSRELWLIRDRIGVKPLYYTLRDGRLTFASEIKALLTDPAIPREVDEHALYHYLSFLTVPAPKTLFKDIYKLEPGHWLRIGPDGTIQKRQYWDVLDNVSPLRDSDDAIAERVLADLKTAVKLRKVSDVPTGVFLSGGIDSSTNAALFTEGGRHSVKTFSVGYEGTHESYPSELPYARRVAEFVSAEHHEYEISENDLIEFLPKMVGLQDEPIGDPVCVPVYFVSKLAKDHGVTVCQVGEGADELFCGYPSWKRYLQLQQWNRLPAGVGKDFGLAFLRHAGKSHSFPYEWLRRGAAGLPIFWSGAEGFTETHKRDLLSPDLLRRLGDCDSWQALEPVRRKFEQSGIEQSPLNWMTYSDLKLRLPELLLMRVDKMSMGVSLEGRVPFLDHKFVELGMSIPTAAKLRNGELKYILKKAVKGVIPDEVIHRKKQGFGVPIHEWFFQKLGVTARLKVREVATRTGLFNQEVLDKILASHNSAQIWYLFNFALWWEHYIAEKEVKVPSRDMASVV